MPINTKNTYGAEIRNKLTTIKVNYNFLIMDMEIDKSLVSRMMMSAIDDIELLADKLKDMPINEYKDLGCLNDWDMPGSIGTKPIPKEYLNCHHKYDLKEKALNDSGTYKECSCEICHIKWQVDSSD